MQELLEDENSILNLNLSASDYINLNYFNELLKYSLVLKVNLDGQIIYVNDKFLEATGYDKEDIINKNHAILRHPDRDPKFYKNLKESIQSGKIYHERIVCKTKDRKELWADATIIPLVNPDDGKIIEYMGILTDITEFLTMQRKLYQQELKQKEQEKISAAKDSFLILFTHELKTPLNAIINFAGYLLKHIKAQTIDEISLEKRETLLTKIEESAKLMLENVTQLLELSRLRANKLTYKFSNVNTQDIVKEVIKNHKEMAKEYNTKIELKSSCQKHTCSLNTDAFRFKQILGNIISNAIKYGHGEIIVQVGECTDDEWILHVDDNGDGIEDVDSAFRLFERDEQSTINLTQEGTGIGLTFVRLLCRDLGFKYELGKSERLGGLKFTLIKKKKENK